MKLFRHEDLRQKGIFYSRCQIWRLRQKPDGDPQKFPDPVKGLAAEDLWTEPDLDEYVERRIAARRKNKTAA